jgi:hypothetical protein
MKKIKKQYLGTMVILVSLIILSGCTNTQKNIQKNQASSNEYIVDQSDFIKGNGLIKDIPESELNEEEIAGLILMREEEKLARDVYNALGEKWGIKIFGNIAESEQTHTDAIKVLLDRYNIEDPIKNDTRGIFTSLELDKLYKNLMGQGNLSLLEALTVGAIIEDLDIKDLNELSTKTDNADIITTYNNLNKGSRNHLRAYIRQIKNNSGTYSPQYISQTEFDNIISSNQERGQVK